MRIHSHTGFGITDEYKRTPIDRNDPHRTQVGPKGPSQGPSQTELLNYLDQARYRLWNWLTNLVLKAKQELSSDPYNSFYRMAYWNTPFLINQPAACRDID